jgi:putative ABC transport system substrate-binding protein
MNRREFITLLRAERLRPSLEGSIGIYIDRRELVTLLSSGLVAWPLVSHAQRLATPVIGFLSSLSQEWFRPYLVAFHQGLKEVGYIESQNVAIEYRWAEGQYDRLPAMAADLVRRQVTVIAATAGNPSAVAAKAATATIPIVFNVAGDPVKEGLVSSLNHPGGNMTGVSILTTPLEAKRLELLHELFPNISAIAVLINPNFAESDTQLKVVKAAAQALGQHVLFLTATTKNDLDDAFAAIVNQQIGALLVLSDPFFVSQRQEIVALATRHAVPTIYFVREFAVVGGLMSYGTSLADAYHQMGIYTGRIVKGEKPGDLPVVQPTRFEFVINLKTAKALGLEIPPTLLARADEVIE